MGQDLKALVDVARDEAVRYRLSLGSRSHAPQHGYRQMRDHFRESTPEQPSSGLSVIRQLVGRADSGLASMAGPRFFGGVLGGSDPVGAAADWLVSAWGQNTGYHTPTPSTAAIEEVTADWLLDLLGLPAEASVGFATGATVANMIALAPTSRSRPARYRLGLRRRRSCRRAADPRLCRRERPHKRVLGAFLCRVGSQARRPRGDRPERPHGCGRPRQGNAVPTGTEDRRCPGRTDQHRRVRSVRRDFGDCSHRAGRPVRSQPMLAPSSVSPE
jgi:hypothetical protein